MSPAKPVRTRIGGPRKKGGNDEQAKPRDFTVAKRPKATAGDAGKRLALERAAYALSVHDPQELPAPAAPELAFAGRSNAGKSSAINSLVGRRRLAFVSKTPGRTQLINFFSLGSDAFLVDLPGYGYAGVPGEVRRHWEHLVGSYIAERASLAGVVVVMDARHPLTALDRQLLDWLRGASRPTHILLTKADKLSKQAAQATLAGVRRETSAHWPGTSVQLFSSLKSQGIGEAVEALARMARPKKQSPG